MSLISVQTNETETNFPFTLENYLNYQYYGSLYIGSQHTYFEYIFDTGSPWLWIPTTDCTSCSMDGLFETSLSSSFTQLQQDKTTITYNTGEVSGFISTETFCLSANDSYCVDDQQFIAVTETFDLDYLQSDGILGLAPIDGLAKSVPGKSSFV